MLSVFLGFSSRGHSCAVVTWGVSEEIQDAAAVPDLVENVVYPGPTLELIHPARALESQPARAREVHRIAPDCGQPVVCAVDEISHVALPASIVIAEEEQAPVVIDKHPPREM